MVHRVLFLTERSPRHQQSVLDAAPPELAVTMVRDATKEQMIEMLPEVEFLITERSGVIDAAVVAAGRKLRLIQRLGSQSYDIDVDAARTAGIPVCYWPIRSCVMVAEHMIMQLLMLAKRAREAMHSLTQVGAWGQEPQKCDENYFAYNWTNRQELAGLYRSTVGLMGYGEVGVELARRLRGFGCSKVLYNKRKRLPEGAEAELGLEFADVARLCAESDFICLLLPKEDGLDARLVAGMKPGACVANIGAFGLQHEEALATAVRAGRIYGVASDTFSYEPIAPTNPLLPFTADPEANVVLTPHTAAGTIADRRALRAEDYANVMAVLRGEPLSFRLA